MALAVQGNVESLQTMLSDPESMAPALPLEISFAAEQVHAPFSDAASKKGSLAILYMHARCPGRETASGYP